MALVHDGVHDRPEFLERMLGINDEPDLYVVRRFRCQSPHHGACILRRVHLHDGRIPEIELRTRDTRNEGTGDGNPGRFRRRIRDLPHLEIPHRSPDINHAGDAAAQITRKDVIQMRFDPCDFVGIWPDLGEIRRIRPGEQIGRLEEVNVSVDITG